MSATNFSGVSGSGMGAVYVTTVDSQLLHFDNSTWTHQTTLPMGTLGRSSARTPTDGSSVLVVFATIAR